MLKELIVKIAFHYYDEQTDSKQVLDIADKLKEFKITLSQAQKEKLLEIEDLYDDIIYNNHSEDIWLGFCLGKMMYSKNTQEIEEVLRTIISNL